MPRAKKADAAPTAVSLSKPATFERLRFWIVGETPLITHAWSFKAKNEMLRKQMGATKSAREKKDPDEDFVNSLYAMKNITSDSSRDERLEGPFGFPVTGVKNCILSSAHKDKGIARTTVMSALFLRAKMVRTMPALASAICDLPLVEIHGSEPVMREDMVRVGVGLNKTAALAYRAQFTNWAILIEGKLNTDAMSVDQLSFLINECGTAAGLGEWRPEKRGMFGVFHLANAEEEAAWDAFAAGNGPLPEVNDDDEFYREAAE